MSTEQLRKKAKIKPETTTIRNRAYRNFVYNLISFLAKVLARLKITGGEHIPSEGGLLLTTNHLSRIDTGILLLNPTRSDDLAPLVTDKYKTYPFIRFLVEPMPHIWIDRSKADFTAFSAAIKYLKDGGMIGIAPEGTRSKIGALIEAKSGTAMIAMRAGVTIVPVGIAGTEDFQRNVRRLRRTDISVRFGPAYTLPPLGRNQDRNEYLAACTEEIMCRIAAQLPEKYHGFYAGHPRIQEILQEQGEKQDSI